MRSRNQPRSLTVIVFGILTLAVVAVGPALAQGQEPEKQEKVTICHYPPGNPENAQTIEVGAPAVIAHVALHGDTIGPCEEDDDNGGGEGEA